MKLQTIADCFLGLLTPRWCACCDVPAQRLVCPDCWATLPWLEAPCVDELPILAAWSYDAPVAEAVQRLKYADRPDLVAPLVRLAAPWLALRVPAADLLIPVPLHPRRLAERGFNQSALLAHALRRHVLPSGRVRTRALGRRVDTGQLAGKGREARQREVEGAFFVRQVEKVFGRRVLLVDDVVTTGATVGACATVLRAAGADTVGVLALCQTGAGH